MKTKKGLLIALFSGIILVIILITWKIMNDNNERGKVENPMPIKTPTRGTWQFGEIKSIKSLDVSYQGWIRGIKFSNPNKEYLETKKSWNTSGAPMNIHVMIWGDKETKELSTKFIERFNFESKEVKGSYNFIYYNLTPKKGVDTSRISFNVNYKVFEGRIQFITLAYNTVNFDTPTYNLTD
jgi:hypothetical protein